jgi:hypothetical protein
VTKNYLGKYIIEIRDLLNFQCYFRSGKVKLPEWVDVVKTNIAKELAPYDEDWYYIRLASMARHIYVRSPVGVQTVCKIYGGNYFFPSNCGIYGCYNFKKCCILRLD